MKIQFIFSGTRFVTQSRQNSCCKRPFMLEKQTSRDLIFISIYKWTKFLTQNKKKATLSNQSFKLAICSFINFKVWSAAIISLRRNHPQDKFADWEGCDLKLSGWNEHWFLGLISGLKCDKCGSYCRPRPKPLSTFFTETSIFVIVASLFCLFPDGQHPVWAGRQCCFAAVVVGYIWLIFFFHCCHFSFVSGF